MQWIVLIVDDHPLVGEALELSVSAAYPHLSVGRVTSMAEAEAYVRANGPRIKLVMLDLVLPDVTGFSGLLMLQQILPDRPIVIVSGRFDTHTVALAKTFGAAAFLNKSAPVSALVNAVGTVLRGEAVITPDEPTPVPAAADFHKKVATLSAGQIRVLNALADGRLNKQIAADMNLTEGTVKQHMSAIFRKLGVANRSQAILAAGPYLRSPQR
jgi:DNA-binding NarL/FixJ family response regulator